MTEITLSPFANELVARLTAPPPDHPAFVGEEVDIDITQLPRDELGAIWRHVDHACYTSAAGVLDTEAALSAARDNKPAHGLGQAIYLRAYEAGHWPCISDAYLLNYLQRTRDGTIGWHRARNALFWRAERQAPLPVAAVEELRRILGPIDSGLPGIGNASAFWDSWQTQADGYLLALSLSPDSQAPQAAALADAYRKACPDERYVRMQLEWLLGLDFHGLLEQIMPEGDFAPLQPPDGPRARLDEQILRDAATHLQAIQDGEKPYVGYKAFSEADLRILTQVLPRCMQRAEPWFAGVAHALLTLSSYPPDRKSKSLPSQTLACKVAEHIALLPTPEGIESIREAAGLTTNATVKRTMETRLQQAKTALGLRPEVVLAMAAQSAPDKKTATLLARLLQASYHTGLDFSLAQWCEKLLHSQGGADFCRALIWQADCGTDAPAVAFLAADATESANGLQATGAKGQPVRIPGNARICLWHPLHATAEERQAWRERLRQLELQQPLRQAWREYFTPLSDETHRPDDSDPQWASNRSECFSDLQLSIGPLLGLARGEGWKTAEWGLERAMGGLVVHFELGDAIHPGMIGDTPSGALSFWRMVNDRQRREPITQVPAVLFSEACRAVDLLVSTCAFAYTGNDPSEPLTLADAGVHLADEAPPVPSGPVHPQLRRERRLRQLAGLPLTDMLGLRRQALEACFAQQCASGQLVFDARNATIGDCQVHLATGKVSRAGEQIELKVPKVGSKGSKLAALPWMPHDEAMLEKLVLTIATLL